MHQFFKSKHHSLYIGILSFILGTCLSFSQQTHFYTQKNEEGKIGFFNHDSTQIHPYKYDWVEAKFFSNTKLVYIGEVDELGNAIPNRGKYGLVDIYGKTLIPCKYDWIDMPYSDGTTWVLEGEIEINEKNEINIVSGYKGVIDTTGKLLIPAEYDDFYILNGKCLWVKKDNKYGIIDFEANIIVPIEYDEVYSLKGGCFKIRQDGKFGLVNKEAKIVTPNIYEDIQSITLDEHKEKADDKKYFRTSINEKYGIIDSEGKEIIPNMYDVLYQSYVGLLHASLNNKKGLLDSTGTPIIPLIYDKVLPVEKTDTVKYIKVKRNNMWGLVKHTGEIILPVEYNEIWMQSNYYSKKLYPFLFAKKGISKRLYNLNGKEISPGPIEDYKYYYSGPINIKQSGKWGQIDVDGNMIVPARYDEVLEEDRKYILVRSGDKWGAYYINGEKLIECKYEKIKLLFDSYGNSLLEVKLNGKTGRIDSTGNIVIPIKYDWIKDRIIDGVIPVFNGEITKNRWDGVTKKTGKYGFVNKEGNEILPVQYDWVSEYYHYGVYLVFKGEVILDEKDKVIEKKGKYGFVNLQGEEITPVQYDDAINFKSKMYKPWDCKTYQVPARVCQGDLWGLIDTLGKQIVPCKYNWIDGVIINGYTIFTINDEENNRKYGFLNVNTLVELPLLYDSVNHFNRFMNASVMMYGKWGLIDSLGDFLVEPKYDLTGSYFDRGVCLVFIGEIISGAAYEQPDTYIGKYGFVNQEGKEVLPVKFDRTTMLNDTTNLIFVVTEGKKQGLLDTSGRGVPCIYDYIEAMIINGFVRYSNDIDENTYSYGFINIVTFEDIPAPYEMIEHFSEQGYAKIKINDNWGLINTEGEIIITPAYDWIDNIAGQGLIRIFNGTTGKDESYLNAPDKGKYGYVNLKGKEKISCQFDEADIFIDKQARVIKNGKTFYVNKKGKCIKDCR